jgi:AraC-like DNA-binding protein
VAALINVVVLYTLSLLARQHDKVLAEVPMKKKLSLLHHDPSKIEKLLSEEAFKDSLLTLSKTAAKLKVPAYVVSHTVNSHFNKSFPELLLATRLKRAQSLLADPAHKYLTIEAIAYESGFSSLSAFYSGFKRVHKITPAQFRAQHEIEGSIGALQ